MISDKFRNSTGFSLVELMVGLTIGLVTVLIVMQVISVADKKRQDSTSGSDAMVNTALGLYTIERDAKNAGYGMTTVQSSVGCDIRSANSNDTVPRPSFNLSPVILTDGAGGAPDTLRFMASSKNGVTLPTRIAQNHPNNAANIFVESDVGVEDGDMMIAVPAVLDTAVPPSTWCSVFQVTGTGGGGGGGQGQNQVIHNSGQSDWNQPGGSTIMPDYAIGDYVINLGDMLDHTYSIAKNNNTYFLHLTDYKMKTNTTSELDMYPHIVQLQAVYGKDTSSPPDGIVDVWNATAPTTPAEWQQIRAIRVALVARSQSREVGVVTLDGAAAASTCASATPHPAAVCWKPDPNANGVKIDVNINSGNPDWQHYRYRVVETTIPFRNNIWQQ